MCKLLDYLTKIIYKNNSKNFNQRQKLKNPFYRNQLEEDLQRKISKLIKFFF